MIITVDCNSDRIEMSKGSIQVEMQCKHPTNVIAILVELLTILDVNDVMLEKIDEDHRTTVEEW